MNNKITIYLNNNLLKLNNIIVYLKILAHNLFKIIKINSLDLKSKCTIRINNNSINFKIENKAFLKIKAFKFQYKINNKAILNNNILNFNKIIMKAINNKII